MAQVQFRSKLFWQSPCFFVAQVWLALGMPCLAKVLLVSSATLCVATDTVVSTPVWVLGKDKKENCATTCAAAGNAGKDSLGKTYKCLSTTWPTDDASMSTILENIEDKDGKATCSQFIDMADTAAFPFKVAHIDKGLCWYNSKASTSDCNAKAPGTERRICYCSSDLTVTKRDPIPSIPPYPAVYKRALYPSLSFSINFPAFTKDAFECLGAMAGHVETANEYAKPEAFFKINHAIRQALGTEAVEVRFYAPEEYSDPLIAKIAVYASPEDMAGARMWLTDTRIRSIGNLAMKTYPELKLCAHNWYSDTSFGQRPTFPSVVMDEILGETTRSAEPAAGVGVKSLSVMSAGVLLVAGVVVYQRNRRQHDLLPSTVE